MAKVIRYALCTRVNRGATDQPIWEDSLSPVEIDWSEANEAVAMREAYKGEYTIEDDGRPAPAPVGDAVTWDELNSAYQEGVDSV